MPDYPQPAARQYDFPPVWGRYRRAPVRANRPAMSRILVAGVLFAMLAMGCGRRWTPVSYVESHALTAPVDPAGMRAAVLRGLQGRRYRIETDEPSNIVAVWQRGSVWFRVGVNYDATGYQIRYLGSNGLRIREEESGEVFVEARYGKWANALNRTIQREVQRNLTHGAPPPAPATGVAASDPTVVAPVTVEVMAPAEGQAAPSLSCCLEGAFYACPSEAAFDACTRLDPGQCSRVPANDGACS